jgi:NitT/TauT family transport system permease protein
MRVAVAIVTAAIFVGAWALIAATLFGDRPYILPRPLDVLRQGFDERSLLFDATRSTLGSAARGFATATVLGIAAAAALSQSRLLTRSLYPYAVILQTIPILATAPIIVLWFKYGHTSIMVISTIIAFFPIFSNTLHGLTSTDRNHVDLFRLRRVGRLKTLLSLRVPSALPNIGAGLRVSAGMSVTGATVGEFLVGSGGAKGGLGIAIVVSQARLQTALLYAEAAMATLLGIAMFLTVNALTHLALRNWHESALTPED